MHDPAAIIIDPGFFRLTGEKFTLSAAEEPAPGNRAKTGRGAAGIRSYRAQNPAICGKPGKARQIATWKTARVFISSTFRDMHAERDHLVKVVFPELREKLEKHRIHLVDIDLRWGVTAEQSDNDRTLDLCLDEIKRSRPFFIAGLKAEQSACLELHAAAWDKPGLLSECPHCRKPLKFKPFVVDNFVA